MGKEMKEGSKRHGIIVEAESKDDNNNKGEREQVLVLILVKEGRDDNNIYYKDRTRNCERGGGSAKLVLIYLGQVMSGFWTGRGQRGNVRVNVFIYAITFGLRVCNELTNKQTAINGLHS